jgi:hypothetical protein
VVRRSLVELPSPSVAHHRTLGWHTELHRHRATRDFSPSYSGRWGRIGQAHYLIASTESREIAARLECASRIDAMEPK